MATPAAAAMPSRIAARPMALSRPKKALPQRMPPKRSRWRARMATTVSSATTAGIVRGSSSRAQSGSRAGAASSRAKRSRPPRSRPHAARRRRPRASRRRRPGSRAARASRRSRAAGHRRARRRSSPARSRSSTATAPPSVSRAGRSSCESVRTSGTLLPWGSDKGFPVRPCPRVKSLRKSVHRPLARGLGGRRRSRSARRAGAPRRSAAAWRSAGTRAARRPGRSATGGPAGAA